MRHLIWATLLLAMAIAGPVIGSDPSAPSSSSVAPTTRPTTRPTRVSVRGRATITPGLDLLKPDLSRVVIYVASDPTLDAMTVSPSHPMVSQRNKLFVPNFLVVRRGTTVEFPNWDHFDHNVFSRSKAAPAFDLDRYPYGSSKSRVFDKLGVVQVFCNVHPSMRAIIFVTPNDCFTRADSEGRFELTGLPPGRYDIVAWHERCEEARQTINVSESDVTEISFTLDTSRKSIIANALPDRRGSYGVERGLGVKQERLDLPVVHEVHKAPAADPDHETSSGKGSNSGS